MEDDIDDEVLHSLKCLDLSLPTIVKSIEYVKKIINSGQRNANRAENKQIIITFGTTGCGKSTILNWLVGCTMESNEDDSSINVLPFDRGGKKDEVFPIGAEHITSKTIIHCIHPLTDTVALCDSPGFVDSRGSEFSIANAVNTMSILKSCGNVGFLLIFNAHEILGLRGDGAKESLRTFIELFGSIELVNKYSDNIHVGITHASRSQQKKALKILLDICFQFGWQITDDRVIFLDPLENTGYISHNDFLRKLVGTKRMCRDEIFNLAPLPPKDILLISSIADELYLSCVNHWETKEIYLIISNYRLLDSLLIIGNQPVLLNAIISIQKLILSNVQRFIETNIFEIMNNPHDNEENLCKSISFLKSLSVLDECFNSEFITTLAIPEFVDQESLSDESTIISSLIETTLLRVKEREARELQQIFYEIHNRWIHLHSELTNSIMNVQKEQPQVFAGIDMTHITIDSLRNSLPCMIGVATFLNKVKQDNNSYPLSYYFGNQLKESFDCFECEIESSIMNIIIAQIIPSKCELLLSEISQSISKLTSQADNAVKIYYVNILQSQTSKDTKQIETKIKTLIEVPSGFCQLELQRLLASTEELKRISLVSSSTQSIAKKYNKACNVMLHFRAQLVSACTKLAMENIQIKLTDLQLCFPEATELLRHMVIPFDLARLSMYPLLTEPCESLLTVLNLLSFDMQLYHNAMSTLNLVLLKLQAILKQTVCRNLSKDIEKNLVECLESMRSEERTAMLLVPLETLHNLNGVAYSEVVVKMLMSCKTIMFSESSNIVKLPLADYRKACLKFEQRVEQISLLFSILKVPIDNINLLECLSVKQIVVEYETELLQDTKNEISAESNKLIEIIRLALDKYLQVENVTEKNDCLLLLQANTVIQTLNTSNCLEIDISTNIKELHKKALLVEHAVVFSDMGNVRLLELVEGLRGSIAALVETANTKLKYGVLRKSIKMKMSELFVILEKSLELNPRIFFVKNDINLDYLQTKREYANVALFLQNALNELEEKDKLEEENKIATYISSVRTRVNVLYSFQLSTAIDGWCVSNTVSANIKSLKSAFNNLKRLGSQRYADKQVSFTAYCDSLQDIGHIQTAIRAKNFNDVFTRRALLLSLKDAIPSHVSVTTEALDSAISDCLGDMFNNAMEEIERPVVVDNFLDFSQLREFMEVSRGLEELTPKYIKMLCKNAKTTFDQLFKDERKAELTALTASESVGLDNATLRDFTKRFVKYFAVARELDITIDFVDRMGGILAQLPAPATDALSRHISELQAVTALASVCGEIFDAFKVFSRINIAQFNRIAGNVTFEKAMLTVDSSLPCNKATLSRAYAVFKSTYEGIIADIVNKRYSELRQHDQMQRLCKVIKPNVFELSKNFEDTAKLVAYVCGHYSFIDAKETYFSGEKDSLLQIHGTQILSIFLLLGIDQSGRATGQLNQILTGEGKSITLAIVAAVYALLGVRTKIVCFSSYLTHKDRKLFNGFYESLFIRSKIAYYTIDDLVHAVMDVSFPDFDTQAYFYLKGGPVMPFVPSVETGVLLIDEVDVFFWEDFYGQLSNHAFEIDSEPAHELMVFIWNNRTKLNHMSVHEATSFVLSRQSKQIDLIVQDFPRILPLLQPIINNCCLILRYYYSIPGVRNTNYFVKDDKIATINRKSGAIAYYTGFVIMFEYCFHHEPSRLRNGQSYISNESFREHVGLSISCGSILYAELPKRFQLVHGVSGTLASFQREENDILTNYGFKRKSFIPSTFQKSSPAAIPTDVVTGDRSGEYFDRIKNVMQEMLRKHRAALVFFETYAILENFRKELIKKPITLPNFRAPEILSDHISPAERDGVISRAINTCKITLCTKLYMRGTDFKCRDTQLVKNGGVHVLLTFYPDTETDEIQARGRTCRQNDPGSFQMILFAQDLVDKNLLRCRRENNEMIPDLSEPDDIVSDQRVVGKGRWDEFLKKKRKIAATKATKKMLKTLADNTPTHEKTLALSRCMENEDIQASVYLVDLHEV